MLLRDVQIVCEGADGIERELFVFTFPAARVHSCLELLLVSWEDAWGILEGILEGIIWVPTRVACNSRLFRWAGAGSRHRVAASGKLFELFFHPYLHADRRSVSSSNNLTRATRHLSNRCGRRRRGG